MRGGWRTGLRPSAAHLAPDVLSSSLLLSCVADDDSSDESEEDEKDECVCATPALCLSLSPLLTARTHGTHVDLRRESGLGATADGSRKAKRGA